MTWCNRDDDDEEEEEEEEQFQFDVFNHIEKVPVEL